MKKFLEALEKAQKLAEHQEKAVGLSSSILDLYKKYSLLIGKRVFLKDTKTNESKIGTIKVVTKSFIVIEYRNYGESITICTTTVDYPNIICGDIILEVEGE